MPIHRCIPKGTDWETSLLGSKEVPRAQGDPRDNPSRVGCCRSGVGYLCFQYQQELNFHLFQQLMAVFSFLYHIYMFTIPSCRRYLSIMCPRPLFSRSSLFGHLVTPCHNASRVCFRYLTRMGLEFQVMIEGFPRHNE